MIYQVQNIVTHLFRLQNVFQYLQVKCICTQHFNSETKANIVFTLHSTKVLNALNSKWQYHCQLRIQKFSLELFPGAAREVQNWVRYIWHERCNLKKPHSSELWSAEFVFYTITTQILVFMPTVSESHTLSCLVQVRGELAHYLVKLCLAFRIF